MGCGIPPYLPGVRPFVINVARPRPPCWAITVANLGHNHVRVEKLEHVHRSDQNEIIEGAGVGHNDHAGRTELRLRPPRP